MATYSGQIVEIDVALTDTEALDAKSQDLPEADTYQNRVWDTQVAGSDKHHYWDTQEEPDYSGSSYDGPGTWATHTSDFATMKVD